MFGLGQYDVNVLIIALQRRGFEAAWFDRRKWVIDFVDGVVYFTSYLVFTRCISISRDPFCIDTSNVLGFILNVPSDCKLGFVVLPFRRRHWIAVRKIHSFFWNLDSKLNAPERIGDDIELLNYLNNLLKSNDVELLVVVSSEVEKSKKWLKETVQWIWSHECRFVSIVEKKTLDYIWFFIHYY